MHFGLLYGLGYSSLVPIKLNLSAVPYDDRLEISVLPTLWQQFGEGPLLFQQGNAPVHFPPVWCGRIDWRAQSLVCIARHVIEITLQHVCCL